MDPQRQVPRRPGNRPALVVAVALLLGFASVRVATAIGAMAAATSKNARVGVADMLTLATLLRTSMEEPAATSTLDPADRELLLEAIAGAERMLRSRAEDVSGEPWVPRRTSRPLKVTIAWPDFLCRP